MSQHISNNRAVFNYMSQTFPFAFKNIVFNNDCLTFNGETIILGDFDLGYFLNVFSYMIGSFHNNEIFTILKTHADAINKVIPPTTIKDDTTLLRPVNIDGSYVGNQEADLVGLDRFTSLIRQESDYNEIDKLEVKRFFEFYRDLLIHKQELMDEVKDVLNKIEIITFEIENPTAKVTNLNNIKYLRECNKLTEPDGSPLENDATLILKPTGYVGAAIIISITVNVGIGLALLLILR